MSSHGSSGAVRGSTVSRNSASTAWMREPRSRGPMRSVASGRSTSRTRSTRESRYRNGHVAQFSREVGESASSSAGSSPATGPTRPSKRVSAAERRARTAVTPARSDGVDSTSGWRSSGRRRSCQSRRLRTSRSVSDPSSPGSRTPASNDGTTRSQPALSRVSSSAPTVSPSSELALSSSQRAGRRLR